MAILIGHLILIFLNYFLDLQTDEDFGLQTEDFDARLNSAFDFLRVVSENLDRLKREFYRKRQR